MTSDEEVRTPTHDTSDKDAVSHPSAALRQRQVPAGRSRSRSRGAHDDLPPATKTSSRSNTEATDAPQPTISPSEHRARLLLLLALATLLLLYCQGHDWRRTPLVVPGGKQAPPLALVARSPLPGSSPPPRVAVLAQHGLVTYLMSLPLSLGADGALPTTATAAAQQGQSFAVYVPQSLSFADAASGGAARVPLVVLLHGPESSATAEIRSRIEEAERSRHVLLCPSLPATVRAQSPDPEDRSSSSSSSESFDQVDRAVDSIAAAIDSVMDMPTASNGAAALGRFLDPSSVQLWSRNDGATAWLAFLLQRPNYWTSATCRNCALRGRYHAEVLASRMAAFAADATAAAAPSPGSEASVTASFWTRYFQDRTVLLESGPLETRQDTDALEDLLRHSFGFQRLQRRMVSSEQPEP